MIIIRRKNDKEGDGKVPNKMGRDSEKARLWYVRTEEEEGGWRRK